MHGIRALSAFFVALLLAGCGGRGTTPEPPTLHAIADPFPSDVSAAQGMIAHYVVEYGTDPYGDPEGDVRQLQEPSMTADAQAGAGAIITYPDGSTQTADDKGQFDSAMSAYASKYSMNVQDPFITVSVSIPSQPSLKTFTAQIVAPDPQQEDVIWSAWEPASAPASASARKPQAANEWIPCGFNLAMHMNYVKPGETADVTAVATGLPLRSLKWSYNSCTDWTGGGSNGSLQGHFEGGQFAFTVVLVTWYKLRYTAPNTPFAYDHAYDYDDGTIGAYVRVMN